MKLFTSQTPDFSLTSGTVDYTRSPSCKLLPKIRAAYDELYQRLGLDRYRIIWCWPRREDCRPWREDIVWILNVDESDCLAIVDGFIWSRIIGENVIPDSIHMEWIMESNSYNDPHAYISEQEEAYKARTPPPGGWWEILFTSNGGAEGAHVLLQHPIPPAWVVAKEKTTRRSGSNHTIAFHNEGG
jgi:hypothetical protein